MVNRKGGRKNIVRRTASKGLNVVGGTVTSVAREKKNRDRNKRIKRQKEKFLKDKKEELDEIKEREREVKERGEDRDKEMFPENMRPNGNIPTPEEDSDRRKELEDEIEDEINNLQDEMENREEQNSIASIIQKGRKLLRAVRRVGIAAFVTAKSLPIIIVILVTTLGFGIFTMSKGTLMTTIIPAGAFVVLTEAEDGGGSSSGTVEASSGESISGGQDIEEGEKLSVDEVMKSAVWPVPSTKTITSKYGPRWGKIHAGVDIAGGSVSGKDAVSVQNGKVVVSEFGKRGQGYGGYGNTVVVQHGADVRTLYAHLDSLAVKVGDEVKAGDKVGAVGNTGASLGAHLHFEVRINDGSPFYKPIDINKYMEDLKKR